MPKTGFLGAKRLGRSLLAATPPAFRHARFRKMLRLDPAPPAELSCELARSREDLEAAFTVLHDAYVGQGFMQPHPSGMRITPYHALPTTSTLVIKWRGEVAGTVSIIRDSAFGFPLERIFDVDQIRRNGVRLAEISSLAIRRDFRHERGRFLFPLLKYLQNYCYRYFGVDVMVIAVNPAHIEFYEALLGFERLTERVVASYDFVNGAPAVGAFIHLRDMYRRLSAFYGLSEPARNLFHYFYELELPQLHFPVRGYSEVSDPVMTPALLRHFFVERSPVFAAMNERDRRILHNLYQGAKAVAYRGVLPAVAPDACQPVPARAEVRFDVKCKGQISAGQGARLIPAEVLDVSRSGFRGRLASGLRFGETVGVKIAIGEFDIADLNARPVRQADDLIYGFVVESATPNWATFIAYLEAALVKPAV